MGLVAAALLTIRSAEFVRVTGVDAELLAELGSGVAVEMVAELVTVPGGSLVPTVVTMVMVACPVGPSVPMAQLTVPVGGVPGGSVQVPDVLVALTTDWPAGMGSFTSTEVAFDGPLLDACRV